DLYIKSHRYVGSNCLFNSIITAVNEDKDSIINEQLDNQILIKLRDFFIAEASPKNWSRY
ncbi:hypothetical protein ACFWDG_24335, partial [Peribacillus sp. NPDC060186]